MISKKGYCEYSYNMQLSVDKDNQVIPGQHVSQSANDRQEKTAKVTLITNPDSKAKRKSYRADKAICKEFPFRSRCSDSKKDIGRVIRTDKFEPLRQAMNKKMATEEAKSVYVHRKVIAEPPFEHIKNWISWIQSQRAS